MEVTNFCLTHDPLKDTIPPTHTKCAIRQYTADSVLFEPTYRCRRGERTREFPDNRRLHMPFWWGVWGGRLQ